MPTRKMNELRIEARRNSARPTSSIPNVAGLVFLLLVPLILVQEWLKHLPSGHRHSVILSTHVTGKCLNDALCESTVDQEQNNKETTTTKSKKKDLNLKPEFWDTLVAFLFLKRSDSQIKKPGDIMIQENRKFVGRWDEHPWIEMTLLEKEN